MPRCWIVYLIDLEADNHALPVGVFTVEGSAWKAYEKMSKKIVDYEIYHKYGIVIKTIMMNKLFDFLTPKYEKK